MINIQGYVYARGSSNHSDIQVDFFPVSVINFPFTYADSSYTAHTDSKGHYSVQLPAAKYAVRCIRAGYFTYYGDITPLDASQIFPSITLVPYSSRLLVPADFPSIQSAIYSASSGDTILVSPGVYPENIKFRGENTVLGSLYLTTGDTTYITKTILDGNNEGRVVNFSDGEDSTAVLCGFTIKNGRLPTSAENPAGTALLCSNSSPTLKNLVITDNTGANAGVVSFIQSDARLLDSRVESGITAYGGIISLDRSQSILSNVILTSCVSYDCAISIFQGKPIIRNLTLSNLTTISRFADSYAVVYGTETDVEVENCIISDNDGYAFYSLGGNPTISHSSFWNNKKGSFNLYDETIVFGRNIGVNANGDSCDAFGNILCDPKFVDAGKGDFRLKNTSPCIGAGVFSGYPLADFYGMVRGTPPDIGAIENSLSTPQSFIQVLAPNGGETWTSGTTHTIAWTSLKVSQVGLEYSPDGGVSWNSITPALSASLGKFDWTAPDMASGKYLIRITAVSGDGASDTSDAEFFVIHGGLADTSWPMFRQNPYHTGTATGSAPASDQLKWKYTLGGWAYSSPAVGMDGVLYLGSDDKCLYAINPDGALKWKYQTAGSLQSSPALASDGTVYVGSMDKSLYAVQPDGSLRWKFTTGGEIVSSPTVDYDGTIYFGSRDGYLYAMNPDGTLKWKYGAGQVDSSPAISVDGSIIVGSKDANLYAVSINGILNWKYPAGGTVDSSPAVSPDGTIYFASGGNYLNAINPNGSLRWKIALKTRQYASPAIDGNGIVYIGSDDFNLYAVKSDGSVKWKYPTGSQIISSPVIGADDAVYFSNQNYFHALNSDGTLRWKYGIGNSNSSFSSPAIDATGGVYAIAGNSNLYVFSPTIITLSAPNGGEEWIAGTNQVISWTSSGTSLLKLEYSTDNGVSWNTIASAVDAIKNNSLIWTVPRNVSATCRVRLSNPSVPSASVQSDSTFRILAPTLTLTAPNGGEQWTARRAYPVTWNSTGVSLVNIEYSSNNGSTWIAVADSVSARDGVYLWRIPDSPSVNCRVRISDSEAPTCSDVSDAAFSITPPPLLTVTAPKGNETLQGGDTLKISWIASGIDSVKIEYSLNGGGNWSPIAERIAAGQDTLSWQVPEESSSNCFVRVSDAADSLIADTCDAAFTILRYNMNAGFLIDSDLQTAGNQQKDSTDNLGGGSSVGFAIYAKDWGNARGFTVTFSWDSGKLDIRPASSSARLTSDEITINGSTFIPVAEANILGDPLLGAGEQHRSGYYTKSFAQQGGTPVSAQSGLIYFAAFRTADILSAADTLSVRVSVTLAGEDGVGNNLGVGFFRVIPGLVPPSNLIVSDIPNDQGHQLKLTWNASVSEQAQLVSGYQIFRSRSETFTNPPVPLSKFTSLDSLITEEAWNTILIDTVAAGTTEYTDPFVPVNGVPYYYWIQAFNSTGASKPVASNVQTAVEETAQVPAAFRLGDAHPNPFNPSTVIEYSLPRNARVLLRVYNVSGQKVATLAEGPVSPGQHSVVWDARGMPSGVYFYSLRTDTGFVETKKVLLLK